MCGLMGMILDWMDPLYSLGMMTRSTEHSSELFDCVNVSLKKKVRMGGKEENQFSQIQLVLSISDFRT
jgi:hypothetical protein